MKVNIGDSFETFAVVEGDHYDHFDINPNYAGMYGVDNLDDIVRVRCTVKDKDLSVGEMYKDKNYNDNCIDYLAFFELDCDASIIMPNIKMFNMCFTYGADKECFRNGERVGTICRLEVEEIGKYRC